MRNKKGGMKLSEFYKIRRLSVLSLYSLIIILAIGFLLPFARTQVGVGALIDLTGDSTITMTSSKNSATVTIDPTMTGVFETTSGAGDIAFSVSTTNYTGYRLTARSTKTTLDKGVVGSFASLVSGVTAEQFGNANNTTLNNRWGYKPSFYNSEENTRYFGSSTTAVTLDQTSVANSTAKNYTISLGARADSSLPSGSYINDNFILEAVANTVPTAILTINYGPHVTGVTIGSTPVTNGETVKLIVGVSYPITMSTEANFSTPSWAATTGTIASASSASTTYIITSADATLTATGLFSGPNIQNLSDANCTTTASLAIDTRDERIYQVKRLEDGRCWMMENLDLGRTALSADLTSANTNLTTIVSYSTFNSWARENGSWSTTTGDYIPVTGTDSVSNVPYGTLYNYYAASASTITGNSNVNNATSDICPAGWRMPTGGTSGEYAAIYAYHNTFSNMRAPEANGGLAYSLSGAFAQSGAEVQDAQGIYWASTAATESIWREVQHDIMMQELYLTEASEEPILIPEATVYLGDSDYRTLGASIRCIKKKPSHTLTINYGTGVQAIYVNGELIANAGTISAEEGFPLPIKVLFNKNYDFSSWSSTSGTIASASEQFTTFTMGSANTTLTATGAVFTGGVIQNLEPENCTTTPAKYKDSRDNQVYTVKRLADGHCWMMENLNLGATNLTTDLTSTNSNLATTVTAATFNGWITDTPSADFTTGKVVPVSGMDLAADAPKGTYYNYYAATGGTINGSSNANNATYDICPAGWRLPTGGSNGELGAIYNNYNENSLIRAPMSIGGAAFGITGYFSGTTVNVNGTYGYYWSSTRSSNTNMRYIMIWSTGSNAASTLNRRTGASIRCVLDQKAISDLIYMQDFATLSNEEKAEVATSMFEGQTYQLTDNRDSKVYNIAKMKDGRIWLAENLDLGRTTLSSNLTSANTNLITTIPYATFNGWKKTTGTMTYTNGEFINVTGTDEASGTAYGTLYNYYAATAGTVDGSESSKDAAFDICPAGWRLPTGGSSGEFQTLYTQYPSNARMRAPITESGAAFTLAGVFYGGAPTYQETNGRLWSSTRVDDTNVNINFMSTTGVSPASTNGRRDGCSIRCIVKTDVYTLTVSYGTGVSSVEVNDITIQNGGTVNLESGFNNSITITLVPGYSFTGWSATSGTIGESSAQSTTYAIGSANATLTASADPSTYTITLDQNNATTNGSTSATATYGSSTLSSITNPSRSYTISFNANGSGCSVGTASKTYTYTFNGWNSTSANNTTDYRVITSAGAFVASAPNNTGTYTNSSSQWISSSGQTLYAGWTNQSFTMPSSTRSGYTCAWNTSSTGDGSSYTQNTTTTSYAPTSNSTLYAKATANTYSLTITFSGSGISSVQVRTASGTGGTLKGTITSSGGSVSGLTYNTTYYLYPTFSTGYGLNYWSKTSTYGSLSSTSSSNPSFTMGAGAGAVTLVSKSLTAIQNLSSSSCTTTASTVYDNRDGQIYTIKRLNDGQCWMMDNLNLGATTLSTNLTSSNTNLQTTVTYSTFNSWKKTSGSGSSTTAEFIPLTGSDSTSGNNYGTLYNICAASAGTVCSNANISEISYDLCPAGWRLPTGTSSGEFNTLYQYYNSVSSIHNSAANGGAAFAYAGMFYGTSPVAQGAGGYYWSSNVGGSVTVGYEMTISSSGVEIAGSRSYGAGHSLRCILKSSKTISNLTYLQEFNTLSSSDKTSVLASMTTGTNYTLKDNRDNKSYTIAKMKDGKVWMTQNLDLGRTSISTNLTSSNTNVVSTITYSTFNSWKKTSSSCSYTSGEFIPVTGTDSASNTPYGTLYNYYAATAGTISGTTNSYNATYDICPAGWRMPTGGSSGEFYNLYVYYSSSSLMRAPIASGGAAFTLSGYFYFNGDAPQMQESAGHYWAQTRYNDTSSYGLYLNTSEVYAASNSQTVRHSGRVIRCVVK